MTVSRDVLYNITMPLGLLKEQQPDVANALIDSGGPWEVYSGYTWVEASSAGIHEPDYFPERVFRLRLSGKRPKKPMTDGEFIAAWVRYVRGGQPLFAALLAMAKWNDGGHEDALDLIDHPKPPMTDNEFIEAWVRHTPEEGK